MAVTSGPRLSPAHPARLPARRRRPLARLDIAGTILFRVVWGPVLLACLAQFLLRASQGSRMPGCGCPIIAGLVGYLGYVGAVIGP